MNILDLETMFKLYEKDAIEIIEKNDNDNKELFGKICRNLIHLRNLTNTILSVTNLEQKRYQSYLKKLVELENIPMQEFHFFYDTCKEKVDIQKNILTLDELTEKQISNHKTITLSSDFDILPYHYAIIQMLYIAILNQDNYNEELNKKTKAYINNQEFKIVYKDISSSIIPFIKEKQDNIIITPNSPISDGNTSITGVRKLNKRFPN